MGDFFMFLHLVKIIVENQSIFGVGDLPIITWESLSFKKQVMPSDN